MMDKKSLSIDELKEKAKKVRREILIMTTKAGSGHPGGSMSATDILIALYFNHLKVNSKQPKLPDRDRFIMSKGHCCPVIYAVLSELGFFDKKELEHFRQINHILQGHTDIKVPGIEMSAGSLGQGLSFGNGVALAAKLDKKDYKTYVMLGDGEIQEGQIWEAAMSSSKYKLDNVIAILDNNGLQIDGTNDEVKPLGPIADKWKSFGWEVFEIDGHDFTQILDVFKKINTKNGKPKFILAKTVKGKGVSFMENKVEYHGKALTEEQLKDALKELK